MNFSFNRAASEVTSQQIKQIKNFRWFALTAFIASCYFIGFVIFLWYKQAEDSLIPSTTFLATTFGLWIILLFEYFRIFKSDIFFSKAWEEKKVLELVRRERQKK